MAAPAAEFGKAVSAFQAANYAETKRICLKLLKKKILVGDTAHLLALVYKIEGKFQLAKEQFERSIAAEPRNAAVLSNYANLLSQHNRIPDAAEMYRRATTADPAQADTWFNWASLLNTAGRFEEAKDRIDKAISLNDRNPAYYTTLGITLRGLERFAESVAAFDRTIELATLNSALGAGAAQNKANTYRAWNEPQKSAACLNELIQKNIRSPEIHFIKACAHYDADEYDQAEGDLNTAIDLRPDYVDAHMALNKLHWERGDDERFLDSYRKNIQRAPQSMALRYAYAAQLLLADRSDTAEEVLRQALQEVGKDAGILHALGVIRMRRQDYAEASTLIDQALQLQPRSSRFQIDKANLLIRHEDYKTAVEGLQAAEKHDPLNQEIWAYIGLCWRLLGDDRASWLNDYERLIDARFLDVPAGYDNLEHFVDELRKAVAPLHKTRRQPLDQSVRSGTQTVGTLLSVPNKVIQDYKKVLSKSIQDYLNQLPTDDAHPFLNRNKRQFIHSGSWSVKLQTGGFHTNHMHPMGWLSNCTYLSVPKAIRPDDEGRKGWIRFGETSMQLGAREQIGRAVCPEEGMRVLFPSFLWHGTFPFESGESRITLPSDIMPKP